MKRASLTPFLLAFLLVSFGALQPASAQEEIFKLTASNGEPDDMFGDACAISGDRAIFGAHEAAYVFDVATGQELLILTDSNGVDADDFGSVAISGDRAIIGTRSSLVPGCGSSHIMGTIGPPAGPTIPNSL